MSIIREVFDVKQVHERCAGIDVHKKNVTVCAITPEETTTKTFGTTTRQLLEMMEWFTNLGIVDVAMESTGSYWKPLFNLLEERGFKPILVNARDVRNVPGRKTDVKDAEWLAQLMQHGLLKASFVPSRAQREERELTRYRRSLIEERAREVNRLQKVLEGCNIKLGNVATDVMGKSGRAILRALLAGENDPEVLAELARGRMRNKKDELAEAMEGTLGPHQRMLLTMQLNRIEEMDRLIEELDREVAKRMRPLDELIERLDEIPGVGRRTAEEVLAETGVDMGRFPTDRHLSSWSGLAPGNDESAGRRRSGRAPKGNPHVRRALVQAAQSAGRTKNTYLAAQLKRIQARRGRKRALVAVAHTILTIMYHMIKDGSRYEELGANFLDRINEEQTVRRAVQRLKALNYDVSLTKRKAA